jgi:hypothetical protein
MSADPVAAELHELVDGQRLAAPPRADHAPAADQNLAVMMAPVI